MATKRQRSNGSWEFRIRKAGVLPRPLYLTFDSEAEGDAYVRRVEQLLERGIVPEELAPKESKRDERVRTHLQIYLSDSPISKADAGYIRVVRDRLPASLALKELDYEWVRAWVTRLKREDNLAPSTIRHHVGAFARFLDDLVRQQLVPFNPVRQLPRGYAEYTADDGRSVTATGGESKATEERDRRLQDGEEPRIRALLAGEKPDGRQRAFELREAAALQALFDLALESAMRLSEMYTLEIGQVDFAKRTVFLDRTKNGSKRQVPLTSVAERVLRAQIGKRKSGLVFPWWSGEQSERERRRTTSLLSRQFGRLFKAAQCDDLHFHDLRHEATARLYERTTLTDLQIAKITGHKDLRQLQRYANLRGSDLAERLW